MIPVAWLLANVSQVADRVVASLPPSKTSSGVTTAGLPQMY